MGCYHSKHSMKMLGMPILRYWPQFLKALADLQSSSSSIYKSANQE